MTRIDSASRRSRLHHRQRVLAASISVLASASLASAGGNWDGDQQAPVRTWGNFLNWDFNSFPGPADSIVFDVSGDGVVDMGAAVHTHPFMYFNDWVTYTLFNGTVDFPAGGGSIVVGASVSSTNGSDYLTDYSAIGGAPTFLDLGAAADANSIFFSHVDTGTFYVACPMTGAGSLTLMRAAGAANTRAVYFSNPSAAYSGPVTITTGTAARLVDSIFGPGRVGTGAVFLQGGSYEMLSDAGGTDFVMNTVSSASGTVRADHLYISGPTPAYAPGMLHVIGPAGGATFIDNPLNLGGTNNASITFTANNGHNFGNYALVLGNTQVPLLPAGTRTVTVTNGERNIGWAGSIRQNNANRQHEQLVTTFVGPTGTAIPSLFDFDPATFAGIPLVKDGTGVLSIEGPNETTSTGVKTVLAGTLRFVTAVSYGTTTGLVGGPAVPVTLTGVPAIPGTPVSAAMGVGYPTPIPPNLTTTGGVPGQSGAFCIDVPGGSGAPFAPGILNVFAAPTALRLGSSDTSGTSGIFGGVAPYNNFIAGTSTYFLGGGGGILNIGGPAMFPGAFAPTNVEMGTSGTLLPGRVNITVPFFLGAGMINIRAGTLGAAPVGVLAATGGTSLGAYSASIGNDGVYAAAPAATPFNGAGQLLLDSATQAGGLYIYGPGGPFGAAGLLLEGGAVGYAPPAGPGPVVPIPALPGVYGAAIGSSLYGTLSGGVVPPLVATNVLHLGGEYSQGTMIVGFPVFDAGFPVALIKSGVDSTLDLTGPAPNFNTGGTAILGGEVTVGMIADLGPGAITIGDGGILRVAAGFGPVVLPFAQVLRVANGPGARSSQISVDAGMTATFNVGSFEASAPGSSLEKTGTGTLNILPPAVYPFFAGVNQKSWGIKATEGIISINQLPQAVGAGAGSAVFDGGTLNLVGIADPGYIAIPVATQFLATYGFGGIQSYQSTISTLTIGDGAFFRVTGARTSSLMGELTINMGPTSILKFATSPLADDTRGTGTMRINGGNVQFTPGAPNIMLPRDGAFDLRLGSGAQFSGVPQADFNGHLTFNEFAGTCTIDAASVGTAGPVPAVAASTWTIGGTGDTAWGAGTAVKGRTQSVPGGAGPYVTGTVNLNRNLGGRVIVQAGALLDIEYGIFNVGGTGDPFTDSFFGTHLPVINNATFNITSSYKHILSLLGVGVTTVSGGAILDVGSSGPVTQSTFNVIGTADVGNVNVSGTTTVGPGGGYLTAHYIRGNTLNVDAASNVLIKPSGMGGGTSNVNNLSINATGDLDLYNNRVIVQFGINPSPLAAIRAYVINGRGGTDFGNATWAGTGGISSLAATIGGLGDGTNPGDGISFAVGYVENSFLPALGLPSYTNFGGQTVDSGSMLIRFTRGADCNLDGRVNTDDVTIVGATYGALGSGEWFLGDFDYDGICDSDDVTVLGALYDPTAPALSVAQLTAQYGSEFAAAFARGQALGSAVPEPATLVWLGLLPILSRRRRRSRSA